MDEKAVFESWKNSRRISEVKEGFTDRVMEEVLLTRNSTAISKPLRMVHRLSGRPLTKTALIVIAAAVGVVRVVAVLFLGVMG